MSVVGNGASRCGAMSVSGRCFDGGHVFIRSEGSGVFGVVSRRFLKGRKKNDTNLQLMETVETTKCGARWFPLEGDCERWCSGVLLPVMSIPSCDRRAGGGVELRH